jgi:transposase
MELVYTSQKSNFDPAKRYRNPEYFERPEAGVVKVTLIGDWPAVAEAYKSVNVEVAIVKAAKPKKAVANKPAVKRIITVAEVADGKWVLNADGKVLGDPFDS